jgi:hypothetical protein
LEFADEVIDSSAQFLGLSVPILDVTGNMASESGPLARYLASDAAVLSDLIQHAISKGVVLIYDGAYQSVEEEYLDTKALDSLCKV